MSRISSGSHIHMQWGSCLQKIVTWCGAVQAAMLSDLSCLGAPSCPCTPESSASISFDYSRHLSLNRGARRCDTFTASQIAARLTNNPLHPASC